MHPTRQDVAANIRAELARRGKTQAWLADLLGVSQQSVSRRLSGRVAFDVDEMGRIATALGLDLGVLLGRPALLDTA